MKARFHRGSDAWGRGSYEIPANAVVGSSDTGMASDSPAPSDRVKDELEAFRAALLKEAGIESHRVEPTPSGNVFMIKQWVAVDESEFERAAEFARKYLKDSKGSTSYIHDADLDDKEPEFIKEENAE